MTPELIGIITVGIALAALIITMISRLEKRIEQRLDRIEATQAEHGQSLGKVQGALGVIRDLLFNRERTPV